MSYVLVIDDNRQMADALSKMVSVFGLASKPAYGSGPGLTILQMETPLAVFLDINMPGVTGHEILTFMRREPRLEKIPAFVVTSDDQPSTRSKALQEGAQEVIIKPIDLDRVEALLKQFGLVP